MVKIVREAQRFDVLLQSWRNLALVAPESISLQFRSELGVNILNFAEFEVSLLRGTFVECTLVLVVA